MVFFPGLVYTFVAWRNVDHREEKLLHPMDCDNASKGTTDPLMVPKPTKETDDPDAPAPKKPKPVVIPVNGAYRDDTQVVDLLVFRLPQTGKPPVDRLALYKKRSATRKAVVARKKAEKAALAATGGPAPLDPPVTLRNTEGVAAAIGVGLVAPHSVP